VTFRHLLQVNDQVHGLMPLELLRPAQDELLRVTIQIFSWNGDGSIVLNS
jgi:hypothetical protein